MWFISIGIPSFLQHFFLLHSWQYWCFYGYLHLKTTSGIHCGREEVFLLISGAWIISQFLPQTHAAGNSTYKKVKGKWNASRKIKQLQQSGLTPDTQDQSLIRSQESDKEKWVVKKLILLKRLLPELDIWVLHMPTLNHQSVVIGG